MAPTTWTLLTFLSLAATSAVQGWSNGYATHYVVEWASFNSQPSCASGIPNRGSLDGPHGANIVAVGDQAGDLPFGGSGTTNLCGVCIKVRCDATRTSFGKSTGCQDPSKEIILQVRDTCPECRPNGDNGGGLAACGEGCTGYHLDIFKDAWDALGTGEPGVIPIQFEETPCNFGADLNVWYRDSSPGYDSFVIQGTDRPINEVYINDVKLEPSPIGTIGGQSWNVFGTAQTEGISYPATIRVVASDGQQAICSGCIPSRGQKDGRFGSFTWGDVSIPYVAPAEQEVVHEVVHEEPAPQVQHVEPEVVHVEPTAEPHVEPEVVHEEPAAEPHVEPEVVHEEPAAEPHVEPEVVHEQPAAEPHVEPEVVHEEFVAEAAHVEPEVVHEQTEVVHEEPAHQEPAYEMRTHSSHPPAAPSSAQLAEEGCSCTDFPVPDEFSSSDINVAWTSVTIGCAQQVSWGKCETDWMKDTAMLAEGYCQISCGRCECAHSYNEQLANWQAGGARRRLQSSELALEVQRQQQPRVQRSSRQMLL